MCCAPCLVHPFCRSLLGCRPPWPVATHPTPLAANSLIPRVYLGITGPQSPAGLVVCHTQTLCTQSGCTAARTMCTPVAPDAFGARVSVEPLPSHAGHWSLPRRPLSTYRVANHSRGCTVHSWGPRCPTPATAETPTLPAGLGQHGYQYAAIGMRVPFCAFLAWRFQRKVISLLWPVTAASVPHAEQGVREAEAGRGVLRSLQPPWLLPWSHASPSDLAPSDSWPSWCV